MTIEVVDSPDILVNVTGPDQISVTVVRGGGSNEITEDTATDLVGVLVGDGSTVSATTTPTIDTITIVDGEIIVGSADLTIDKPVITEGRIRVELDTNVPTANFLALHNANTTDGTGASIAFRTQTTGAGATDRELAHIRAEVTTHDDATRSADLVIGLSANGSGASERLRIKSNGQLAASDTSDIEIDLIEGHLLYDGVEIIDWGHGALRDFDGNLLIALESANECVLSLENIGMASKAYADALVVGLVDDRGNYNAGGNVFPSSGGSGTAGAILKGDLWTISVAGTLGGTAVTAGDSIRALVDTPGQTASNWAVTENNFGFTPESSANKDTDGTLAADSDTKYASQKATKTYADTKLAKSANLSDLANAAAARTNLGGTTVGQNLFTKANPSAVRFIRVNADNSVDFLTASEQLSALGILDPSLDLRGSYHLLPCPQRPRWDVMENIPAGSGSSYDLGGNSWSASTGNTLSSPGSRNGSTYGDIRMRTMVLGPSPVAGTQMAQLRQGTRASVQRSQFFDLYCWIMFRFRTIPTLSQGFVGWSGASAEYTTTQNLQSLTNVLGVGYEQSGGAPEANWYLYHNDSSGTCTRVDLGANFPTAVDAVYCLWGFFAANGNVAYQVNRMDSLQITSGLLTTELPSLNQQMFGHVYQTNGGTAVQCHVEHYHHFAAIKN
jgi:hypothetical protein